MDPYEDMLSTEPIIAHELFLSLEETENSSEKDKTKGKVICLHLIPSSAEAFACAPGPCGMGKEGCFYTCKLCLLLWYAP